MSDVIRYQDAVQTIKTAILQSQYEAAKASNATQLKLYYAIGRYVSANTREGKWGNGAIEAISDQLQKELPGLRGFSATNLKYMRTFYEEWASLDELVLVSSSDEHGNSDSDSKRIRHLKVTNLSYDMQEVFLTIGFTHHRIIFTKVKDIDERMFYIRKCAKEHMSVETLKLSIHNDDYHHQGVLPNNFQQALSPNQSQVHKGV